MSTFANVVNAMLEKVNPVVEELHDKSSHLYGLVKAKAKVERVSQYFWRTVLVPYAGGTLKKVNMDAGSLGHGSGMTTLKLQAAFYDLIYMVKVSQKAIDLTGTSDQSRINVVSWQLANAMSEVNAIEDIVFHTDGTGKLTGIASAASDSGAATESYLTFAGATDYLGINRLREGMVVDAWNTTTRVTPYGSLDYFTITKIDYDTKTVYFNVGSSNGSGLTTTTYLTIAWVGSGQSYGAASPLSFQSTYPGTAGQSTAIAGDSFVHGFPYMTDYTSSNYFYGNIKTTFPKLNPPSVNAAGSPFSFDHIQRWIVKNQRRMDGDVWKNVIGITDMVQRMAISRLGTAITYNLMSGENLGPIKDLTPTNLGYTQLFNLGGIPTYCSKRADKGQIHFINPNKIGIAESRPMGFYQNMEGKRWFEGRDSTGAVNAFFEFGIAHGYDLVCFNPAAGFGQIYGIGVDADDNV